MTKTTEIAKADIFEQNQLKFYGSYEELKQVVTQRLANELESMVRTRWCLGGHVKALLEGARKDLYGKHKIEELEEDFQLDKKTLYLCKTLFETFSKEDLDDKIVPAKIPLRALNYLVRVHDEEKRAEYLRQLQAGEIKAEDIPRLEAGKDAPALPAGSEVLDVNAEDVTPGRSEEGKAAAAIQKAAGAVRAPLELAEAAVPELERKLADLNLVAGDDKLYGEIEDGLRDLMPVVERLQAALAALAKSLKGTMA